MEALKFLVLFYSSYLGCFLIVLALSRGCLSAKRSEDVLCIKKERIALLKFKNDLINGANRLTTWIDEEDDCCKWGGVVCNNLTGHVHELHLRGPDLRDDYPEFSTEYYSFRKYKNDLKARDEEMKTQKLGGKINPSLLVLDQLELLDLSLNDFGGVRIPSFIGSLRNLRHLNISEAQFSVDIPNQLGNLSRLQVLSLERLHSDEQTESVKSLQWLSGLSMLQQLYLSEVDLSGATDWLQVINTLPSLIELHLSTCNLPLIPVDSVTIANLTSLSVLDLSYNNLGGTNAFLQRWIFSSRRLVSLDITECFYDLIPGNYIGISNLTSLKMFSLSGNNFVNSSSTMKELSSLGGGLVSLDMHSCDLSSSVLAYLHNMTSLADLYLSSNALTKAIQSSFGNFCNLKRIDLSENDFRGLTTLSEVLKGVFECASSKLVSLNLKSSNISGDLPYQLGELKHLVHLDLHYNSISGLIPSSIGSLSSLESLNLGLNSISGPIPFSIGKLASLKLLDLSSNTLSGPIPVSIGNLLSLEGLYFSRNRLNGSIPKCIGQLWKLKHLDIAENKLTGLMAKGQLANLTRLERFMADLNSLTIAADWIPPSQLQLLGLNSLSLGPQFPVWLQRQKRLYYLDIANTGISDTMPIWFWDGFSGLTYLNISCNQMHVNFSRIPASLEVLDANSMTSKGPLPELSQGSVITLLDLSNNMFSGSLLGLLCPTVQTGEELCFLNLGNNNLSGAIPECWEKWPNLLFLNLENNKFSGVVPSSLGSSTKLIYLNMRKNNLFGRLPYSLTNLAYLDILLLEENNFKETIPTWIGTKLQSLRILKLRSNKFQGDISDELCLTNSIRILDLARNNLSGQIPTCFSDFNAMSGKEDPLANNIMLYDLPYGIHVHATASLLLKGREDTYNSILGLVTLLDLSSNYFSGHIPTELTSLVSLQSLNLSRNHLTGSIPERVGDMKLLESLDLSKNQLSGEIPLSLSSLSFLNHLNVSYNSLTGKIPLSTQIQSLDNSSFIGNKLCGLPLTTLCGGSPEDGGGGGGEGVEEANRPDWGLCISILSGFALGFWVIVAPLMLSRSWRIAFFGVMYKVRYNIYYASRKCCRNVFCK